VLPAVLQLHAPRSRRLAAPPRRPRSCFYWHNSFSCTQTSLYRKRAIPAGRARPAAPLPSEVSVHAQGSRAAASRPARTRMPAPQQAREAGAGRARARSHLARRLRARLEERDLRAQLVQLGQVGRKPGAQLAAAVHVEEGQPVDAQVARDKVGQRGVRAVHLRRAARGGVSQRRGARRQRRRVRCAASAAGRRLRAGARTGAQRGRCRVRGTCLISTLPYPMMAGPRTDRKVTSGLLRASFFSPGYSRRQPGHQGTQKSATSRRWPATAARNAAGLAAGSRFRGSSPSHLARAPLASAGIHGAERRPRPCGRPRKQCFIF